MDSPTSINMERLLKLVCDEYESDGVWDGKFKVFELTEERKKEIVEALQSVSLYDEHIYKYQCTCEIKETVCKKFWGDTISEALINLDVFKWMCEDLKMFPIDTDEKLCCHFMNVAYDLLSTSGTAYDDSGFPRKKAMIEYVLQFLIKKYPKEICQSYPFNQKIDQCPNFTLLLAALCGYSDDAVSYVNQILDVYQSLDLKIPVGQSYFILFNTIKYVNVDLLRRVIKFIHPDDKPKIEVIFDLLFSMSNMKNVERIKTFAECLDILISSFPSIDLTQSLKYEPDADMHLRSNSGVSLNISDHVDLYGWIYQDSPVCNVLLKYINPFPEPDLAREEEMPFLYTFLVDHNEYYRYLKPLERTKDPKKYFEILDQLKQINAAFPTEKPDLNDIRPWRDVPSIGSFLKSVHTNPISA